ncbi:hypothetical protein J7373_16420 [Xanthomonas sp. A2111]|uniref:Uncharacterized protein n=1 Tax=Xanthomonas hawaiiensis TaxID=3003247 RepID=A0ABU2I6S4_9XANT|nr:hypothetical protein [Xanthomonas sp. A2111]MBO9829839.1 hypothetical protein [Xanthomonas sp. A2111]MDS9993530.1 hypothetical protein [Xanthomonas sp. A2111]
MRYRIEQEPKRDAFGNYRYRIYDGIQLVARYWHDYRGDDHGIEFANGKNLPCPGRMTDFIKGGGPEPMVLSEQAAAYTDQQLA